MAAPPVLARSVSHSSSKKSSNDAEAHPVKGETYDVFDGDEAGVDPVYQAKARILNDAFQEIGMGRYQARLYSYFSPPTAKAQGCAQWYLFIVAGFGWFS